MAPPKSDDNVKVCVRCRPLNEKETSTNNKQVVSVDRERGTVSVRNPDASGGEPPKVYSFDHVFAPDSKQVDIYNLISRPIVDAVLEGFNGTVFAYGQTGTGKTFTMEGIRDKPELRGIIPNSFAHIFGHIAKAEGDIKFLVRVSYLEIYNEEVRDLLGKDQNHRLEVKERPDVGVYVKDLSSVVCHSADDMERTMSIGNRNRSTGSTNMNESSSRSHAIFSITIECSDKGPDGAQRLRAGKLHLVDLAGSERQSKTGATGIRLKEATKINLSLSTLGNVISALVDGKSTHIPYRNSKLTRLLQDSLGGNSKTVMVANVGPADYNYDESISTLRYATRAKSIKNHAVVNEDPKDALLRQYQKEIDDLRRQLEGEDLDGEGDGTESGSENEEYVDENGKTRTRKKTTKRVSAEKLQEIQAKIDEERKALSKKKGLEEAEKNKIAQNLEKREKELKRAQDEQRALKEKLEQLEKKIIVGGENLLEKAEKQNELLKKSEEELKRTEELKEAIKKKLDERAAEKMDLEEKYSNLNEEVRSKTNKLKKLRTMIMEAKSELDDINKEHNRAKEGLLESIRESTKEIKMQTFIINNYIPKEFQQLIEQSVMWNEDLGEWQLKCIAYTGNHMRKQNNDKDKKDQSLDFNHLYLSYTAEGAEQQMKQNKKNKNRAKSAKKKTKQQANDEIIQSD